MNLIYSFSERWPPGNGTNQTVTPKRRKKSQTTFSRHFAIPITLSYCGEILVSCTYVDQNPHDNDPVNDIFKETEKGAQISCTFSSFLRGEESFCCFDRTKAVALVPLLLVYAIGYLSIQCH